MRAPMPPLDECSLCGEGPQNELSNGGFEVGAPPTSWIPGNGFVLSDCVWGLDMMRVSSPARSGIAAVFVPGTGPHRVAIMSEHVAVTPRTRYSSGAWVRLVAGYESEFPFATALVFWAADGTPLPQYHIGNTVSFPAAGVWVVSSAQGLAPDGAVSATLALVQTMRSDSMYIDDAFVTSP